VRVRGALAQLEQLAQLVLRQHRRVDLALRSASAQYSVRGAEPRSACLCVHQVLQTLFGQLPLVNLRRCVRSQWLQLEARQASAPFPRWYRCSGIGTRTHASSARRATRGQQPACRWLGSSRGQTAPGDCRR
jgi:hypothetical protein